MQIAELKGFDGAVWARVPVELGSPIQILGPDEIEANMAETERLTAENERLRAVELAAVRCVEDGDISKLMTALSLNQQQPQDRDEDLPTAEDVRGILK